MCNFIIRPIKSYATVDINSGGASLIKAGDEFVVEKVEHKTKGTFVVGMVNDTAGLEVPLEVYLHTFSDKEPKQEKKSDKKSE